MEKRQFGFIMTLVFSILKGVHYVTMFFEHHFRIMLLETILEIKLCLLAQELTCSIHAERAIIHYCLGYLPTPLPSYHYVHELSSTLLLPKYM